MSNVVTLSDLRSDLPSFIKKVEEGLERFVVTVSGKPKAVILSAEELESLEETAEVLSTVDLKALKNGMSQAKKRKGVKLDTI